MRITNIKPTVTPGIFLVFKKIGGILFGILWQLGQMCQGSAKSNIDWAVSF
jgi:hypothetical protein